MRGVRLFNFSRVHVDKSIIDKKNNVKHGKNYSQPLLSPSSRIKKNRRGEGMCLFKGRYLFICLFLALEKQRDPPAICFGSFSPRGPYMVQEITYKLATFVVILYVSLLYLHLVLVYSYQAII